MSSGWRDSLVAFSRKISEDYYRFKGWTALVVTTPAPRGPNHSRAVEKDREILVPLQRGARKGVMTNS